MKRKLPGELGLFSGTVLWVALVCCVGLGARGHGLQGQPPPSGPRRGSSASGEAPSLWRRLRVGAPTRLQRMIAPSDEIVSLDEALARLGADRYHAAGQKGRGIKVAVLDSGFKGYRGALGKALPANVRARSFRFDGDLEARESQHGILCAEVIHAVAPEAELLFANWEPERPAQFAQAVKWARSEGARIISCSIIMPTWSDGEGTGPTHQLLTEAIGPGNRPGDVLMFASAGNTALRHWSGAYRATADGWHDWGRGRKTNAIHPLGKDRISVELSAPGGASYELVVRDTTDSRDLGVARSSSSTSISTAVVRFDPKTGHDYAMRVRRMNKPAKDRAPFHLTILGGRLQTATKLHSVPFPGDGAEVIAVGAVDGRGRRLSYSSCGPTAGRTKPDLVAPVPFPCSWRPGQPFAGTSAASPQAAALAALVWARNPTWSAAQVRVALTGAARRGATATAWEMGRGVLHLPEGRR